MKFKAHLVLSLLSLCFFLSACGGPKVVTIESVGNEMKYNIKTFEVKAGESVRLVMDNKATMPVMKHNIVILDDNDAIDRVGKAAMTAENYLPNDASIIAATPMAGAGEVTEIEFTAPTKPGKYPFICTFPGHYMMMQGVMIVN
jgi:azurin